MKEQPSYCFVFICQQGELEVQSLLLASSLKCFLRGHVELIAAIPQPEEEWGAPAMETVEALLAMGVGICSVVNPIGSSYPIGNKLACLQVNTDADYIVFLDSDMLCMREFSPSDYFNSHEFYAKPADVDTYGHVFGRWKQAYECCGVTPPQPRVLATVSQDLMMPYFNAGLVAVRTKTGFAEAWQHCAVALDASEMVENKRPWLDQIALPVALFKVGNTWASLDDRFNFPAHVKPMSRCLLPFFCHYHRPEVIRREPRLNRLVFELVDKMPSFFKQLMSAYPDWKRLLRPHPLLIPSRLEPMEGMDLIISGVPRSGTSYLCSLLDRAQDVVAMNEPAEIFESLKGRPDAAAIAMFHHKIRVNILDGVPVYNKIRNGMVIEDTAQYDEVSSYSPQVGRSDFLLCSKNTIAYLARIQHIRRAMPHAPMIICVRHPLDTIASWKSTFGHLRDAEVERFPVGGLADSELSMRNLQRLSEIEATESSAMKRALLWDYLSSLVLDNLPDCLLVRYESLVRNPAGVLEEIFSRLPAGHGLRVPDALAVSDLRTRRDCLQHVDLQAINQICGQRAALLGYELYDDE